jgi:hypothetical protein
MAGFTLRKYIRKILLETSNTACNHISFGFIDDEGNLHDIEEYRRANPEKGYVIDHDSYLYELFGDKYAYVGNVPGWLKITNMRFVQYSEDHFWSVTTKQIDAIIDMLVRCQKYSPWIKQDLLGTDVEFYGKDDLPPRYYYNMSWPDFIAKHGTEEQVERLFELFPPV